MRILEEAQMTTAATLSEAAEKAIAAAAAYAAGKGE